MTSFLDQIPIKVLSPDYMGKVCAKEQNDVAWNMPGQQQRYAAISSMKLAIDPKKPYSAKPKCLWQGVKEKKIAECTFVNLWADVVMDGKGSIRIEKSSKPAF